LLLFRRIAGSALLAAAVLACDSPDTVAVAPVEAAADIRAGLPIQRPNFVVILTDDQRLGDLAYMPATKQLVGERGVTFRQMHATTPLCCPSRTSILRGQYAHNHQVLDNAPPSGGYSRFNELHLEQSTIATWLDAAGYRTTFIGKYLNGFFGNYPAVPARPPGWDNWHPSSGEYYGSLHIHDSTVVLYGYLPQDYRTDIETEEATSFIRASAGSADPFFIYVAPVAPHNIENGQPPIPAPRHNNRLPGVMVPRTVAFNEADVSDKPAHVQRQPLGKSGWIGKNDYIHRRRLQSLLAVDEMVQRIVQTLDSMRLLDRTYIIFTSDNGFQLGEHRLRGKSVPYEESIKVPLLVRGPRAVPGTLVDLPTLNVDLAPTIAALANIETPSFVDGRSLVPLLVGRTPSVWRRAVLFESWERFGFFTGIRSANYKYVEWYTGERELYDLRTDPFEASSMWGTASIPLQRRMTNTLSAMRTCAGQSCRDIEAAARPEPPLP
jgi:N-acetylglucosamine-6-sulfatase